MASILEREVIFGSPAHYTGQCVVKREREAESVADIQKTLLGNSWSVPVVACLLKQLFESLVSSVQEIVDRPAPGGGQTLQRVLQRPQKMDWLGVCQGWYLSRERISYCKPPQTRQSSIIAFVLVSQAASGNGKKWLAGPGTALESI